MCGRLVSNLASNNSPVAAVTIFYRRHLVLPNRFRSAVDLLLFLQLTI